MMEMLSDPMHLGLDLMVEENDSDDPGMLCNLIYDISRGVDSMRPVCKYST